MSQRLFQTSERGFSGQACASLHCDTWDKCLVLPLVLSFSAGAAQSPSLRIPSKCAAVEEQGSRHPTWPFPGVPDLPCEDPPASLGLRTTATHRPSPNSQSPAQLLLPGSTWGAPSDPCSNGTPGQQGGRKRTQRNSTSGCRGSPENPPPSLAHSCPLSTHDPSQTEIWPAPSLPETLQ